MNKYHLWWIIPITLLIGTGIGIRLGFDFAYKSVELFGKWSCDVGAEGMSLCTDIVRYMKYFNGTTDNAFKQYAIDNNETLNNFTTNINILFDLEVQDQKRRDGHEQK